MSQIKSANTLNSSTGLKGKQPSNAGAKLAINTGPKSPAVPSALNTSANLNLSKSQSNQRKVSLGLQPINENYVIRQPVNRQSLSNSGDGRSAPNIRASISVPNFDGTQSITKSFNGGQSMNAKRPSTAYNVGVSPTMQRPSLASIASPYNVGGSPRTPAMPYMGGDSTSLDSLLQLLTGICN
jgi:hypothetical protein